MFIPFHDENPIQRWPIVTVAIIVINLASLLYVNSLPDHDARVFQATHGFVPARLTQLKNPQPVRVELYGPRERQVGIGPPPGNATFLNLPPDKWDIVSSSVSSLFLHAGWMHFIGNMWFFWIFGNNIEDRLGHVLFLLFYLVGGIIASTAHWVMANQAGVNVPVIGASGAVAVTLGAYAVTYPFARVRTLIFLVIFFTVVELPALVVLGFWFLMQMFNAANVLNVNLAGGVAWWAHIGGFVAGALIMPLLAAGTPDPGRNWDLEAREQFELKPPPRDWS